MTDPPQALDDRNKPSLATYDRLVDGVEGWLNPLAAAVCDAMLAHQSAMNVRGDMFEIGGWHGRSAILWLLHARPSETVYLVDIEARPPLRANLDRVAEELHRKYVLTKASSFHMPDAEFLARHRRAFRLIHIDGDHSAAGVSNDLEICAELLHRQGVMVVDDFMNAHFPQITEVVFAFIARQMHDYSLVASGGNKGYIVCAKFWSFWADFVRDGLAGMVRRSVPELEFRAGTVGGRECFGLREKSTSVASSDR